MLLKKWSIRAVLIGVCLLAAPLDGMAQSSVENVLNEVYSKEARNWPYEVRFSRREYDSSGERVSVRFGRELRTASENKISIEHFRYPEFQIQRGNKVEVLQKTGRRVSSDIESDGIDVLSKMGETDSLPLDVRELRNEFDLVSERINSNRIRIYGMRRQTIAPTAPGDPIPLEGSRLATSNHPIQAVSFIIDTKKNLIRTAEIYYGQDDLSQDTIKDLTPDIKIRHFYEKTNIKVRKGKGNIKKEREMLTRKVLSYKDGSSTKFRYNRYKINKIIDPKEMKIENNIFATARSATARSASGSSGGLSDAGMLDSVPYLTPQGVFSVDDFELSQGLVQFSEVDVKIPGLNGLDVAITRQYNSQNHSSHSNLEEANRIWGAWISGGWSFGFAKRAVLAEFNEDIIRASDPDADREVPDDRVMLEGGNGSEIYYWNEDEGVYMSRTPGNLNKVTVNKAQTKITLLTTTGIYMEYAQEFHDVSYRVKDRRTWHKAFSTRGFFLTRVRDQYGNTITYEYESATSRTVKSGHNKDEKDWDRVLMTKFEPRAIMHAFTEDERDYIYDTAEDIFYRDDYYDMYKAQWRITRVRPSRIIDTVGRTIEIGYDDKWPGYRSGDHLQVTSIKYPKPGGSSSEKMTIKYGYNSHNYLAMVQLGELPAKTYEYSKLNLDLHYYLMNERFTVDYTSPFGKWTQYGGDIDRFDPRIIIRVNHPTGAYHTYTYASALQHEYGFTGPSVRYRFRGRTGVGIARAIPIKKTVYPSTTDTSTTDNDIIEFKIRYVGASEDKREFRNVMSAYVPAGVDPDKPDKDRRRSFYFASAIVDAPDEIYDTKFIFSEGKLRNAQVIDGSTVISETITHWDHERNLKLREYTMQNGIQKNRTDYLSYDDFGNATQILLYKGSEVFGRRLIEYNNDIEYTIKDITQHILGRVAKDKYLSNGLPGQSSRTRSTFSEYNNKGMLTAQYKGEDSNGTLLKSITYDSVGRVRTETSNKQAGQLTARFDYDRDSERYQIRQTTNGKTSYINYDSNSALPKKSVDVNGNITTTEYDEYGRVTSVTFPDGSTRSRSYDNTNLEWITTTYLGLSTTQHYDSFGRVIEVDGPTDSSDKKVHYYFANKPSYTERKKPGELQFTRSTSYTYDKKLRTLTKTNEFGTSDRSQWQKVTTTYDDINRTVTVEGPSGHTTTDTYDSTGDLISSTFSGDGGTSTYQYNDFGKQTHLVDSRGNTHESFFDELGRVTRVYHPYQSLTERSARSEIDYHETGEIDESRIYDRSGSLYRTYSQTYDIEGRITSILVSGNTVETMAYDESGHGDSIGAVTRIENDDMTMDFVYDNMGRVTEETTGIKAAGVSSNIETAYNSKQLVESITFNDGKEITYTYDDLHRLTGIDYDGQNIVDYTYTNDRLSRMTYGNGHQIDYGFDHIRDALITQVEVRPNSSAEPTYYETYTYNDIGHITNINLLHPVTSEVATKSYTYNSRDELTQIGITTSGNTTTDYKTYSYDKGRNITSYTLPGDPPTQHSRTIDESSDRLISQEYDGGIIRLSYDPEGNITEKAYHRRQTASPTEFEANPFKRITYSYNYMGQLETVREDGRLVAEYGYRHDRLRVYSNTPGSKTHHGEKYYHYNQGGQVIAEGHKTYGDHTVRYIYSGNEKIAMIRPKNLENRSEGEEIYWFINNMQGTPVRILNAAQQVVSAMSLDEWGNLGSDFTGQMAEVNFTGKKLDAETGLYYFGSRYYDPELGIFLTEDPAGQLLNPYVYAGNNPLTFVDPDGEWFFSELLGSIGGPLGAFFGAVIDGAIISGGVSAATQMVMNGKVDLQQVGQAAIGGAVSAGLMYISGSISDLLLIKGKNTLFVEGGFGRALMHLAAGGTGSAIMGGDFFSGAAGAFMAQVAHPLTNSITNELGQFLAVAGVGAFSSAALGGDFVQGGLGAAFGWLFNHKLHSEGAEETQGSESEKKSSIGEKLVRSLYKTEDQEYWDRYNEFVDRYSIDPKVLAPLLVGAPVPKSVVIRTGGRGALLGSSNQNTSLVRAMGLPGARVLGRFLVPVSLGAVAVTALYNVHIGVQGYFYVQ